jgi:WD40 repeat protein
MPAAGTHAPASSSLSSSRPSSPASAAVLYSAGDDGLVRRWDARLLAPVGAPLTVHHSAVKALAMGDRELLVSGDASGEVAVWLL